MEENIERKGREQNGREQQFKEKNIVSKLVNWDRMSALWMGQRDKMIRAT